MVLSCFFWITFLRMKIHQKSISQFPRQRFEQLLQATSLKNEKNTRKIGIFRFGSATEVPLDSVEVHFGCCFTLPALPAEFHLKLTAKAPGNGWLEYDPFILGPSAYFQGRTGC